MALAAAFLVATIVGVALESRRIQQPEPLSGATSSPTPLLAPTHVRTVVADLGYSIALADGWRRSELLSGRTGDALQPGHDLYTVRTPADEKANAGGETGGPSWFWALLVMVERNRDRLNLRQWIDEGHVGFVVGQRVEDAAVAGRPGLNVIGGTRGEVNYLASRDDLVYSLSYRTQGQPPPGATKADLDAMIASVQLLDTASLPSPSPTPDPSASSSTIPGIESHPLGQLQQAWTFVSRLRSDSNGSTLELWAVEIFGTRRLLALRYEEQRALTATVIRRQLSPDGRRMVLSTPAKPGVAGGYRLTIVDLATGRTTALTDGQQRDTSPAWSPDGSRIAFVRVMAPSGDVRLFTIGADGRDLNGPQPAPSNSHLYGWSDDSKYLVYAELLSSVSLLELSSGRSLSLAGKMPFDTPGPLDWRMPTAAFPRDFVGVFDNGAGEITLDVMNSGATARETIARRPKPAQIDGMLLEPRWRPGSPSLLYRLGYEIYTIGAVAGQRPSKVPVPGRVLRAEWAYEGNSIVYIVDGPAGLERGATVRIALADGGSDRTLFIPPSAGDTSDLEDIAVVTYR